MTPVRRELGQMDAAPVLLLPGGFSAPSLLTQGIRRGINCGFDDPRGYSMVRLRTGAAAAPCQQPEGLGDISACPTGWALAGISAGSSQAGSSPGRLHQSLGKLIKHQNSPALEQTSCTRRALARGPKQATGDTELTPV